MKNKIIYLFLIFFFLKNNLYAKELYTFETKTIEIVQNGDAINAKKGKVFSNDKDIEIFADNFFYSKLTEELKISGNALIFINSSKLKIEFDEGIIDKEKFIFRSKKNVKLSDLKNNILVRSKELVFNKINKILTSSYKSKISDYFGNQSFVDNFDYNLNKNLLRIQNLDFYDKQNNNIKLSNGYLDIKTNNLYGKDVAIKLNDDNLKINKDNEPRLKGNSIKNNQFFTEIKKGVFTTCKKTENCPAWEISAKKILHDKKEKKIKYEDPILKFYDKPFIYLPKFEHPDPTVDRQTGFLTPSIKSLSDQKNFFSIPYFVVLADNKDVTFSPRFYDNEELLLQTEYREVNYMTNHISDFSLKIDDNKKLKNHFFYKYTNKFDLDNFIENYFDLKIQTTSKDTYIKKNKINSVLIENENVLENSATISLSNDDSLASFQTTIFEDLSKNDSDRYEYIFPKINFSKLINHKSDLNGDLRFDTEVMLKQYDTNIEEKTNINNLLFSSNPVISKLGFLNNFKLFIKNSNTDAKNSSSYKNKKNYYLSSVLQLNSSLPLKKENERYEKFLNPKLSLRIAPDYTKNNNFEYTKIDINNIYSLNRIEDKNSIEGDVSLTYGNEYIINDKKNYLEMFNFKIANNIRLKENKDLTNSSQLGKKVSSILSEITIRPNDQMKFKYNSSIKNNLNDLNYENLIAELNINNILGVSFDYLNQNESLDQTSSYLTKKVNLKLNNQNQLIFSTRTNIDMDLTEYNNLAYKYENDCLSASIEYNKEFYQDRDVKPNDSLFFKLTIIPTENKKNYLN
jgi:LPS-assembly protein